MNTDNLIRFPKFRDEKPLRLMTIQQVMDLLSITRPTLHKWTTKDNLIKSIKIGGRVYYKGQDIDNLLRYR